MMIVYLFLAFTLPLVLIKGIASIPAWLMAICGVAGILGLCVLEIRDVMGWGRLVASILGVPGGLGLLAVSLYLTSVDEPTTPPAPRRAEAPPRESARPAPGGAHGHDDTGTNHATS